MHLASLEDIICHCAQGRFTILRKGSFTYYVITKGEGVFLNDYANVIFALSNVEFDYGRGRGLETDKKWLRNMWTTPNHQMGGGRLIMMPERVKGWAINYLIVFFSEWRLQNWRKVIGNFFEEFGISPFSVKVPINFFPMYTPFFFFCGRTASDSSQSLSCRRAIGATSASWTCDFLLYNNNIHIR